LTVKYFTRLSRTGCALWYSPAAADTFHAKAWQVRSLWTRQ